MHQWQQEVIRAAQVLKWSMGTIKTSKGARKDVAFECINLSGLHWGTDGKDSRVLFPMLNRSKEMPIKCSLGTDLEMLRLFFHMQRMKQQSNFLILTPSQKRNSSAFLIVGKVSTYRKTLYLTYFYSIWKHLVLYHLERTLAHMTWHSAFWGITAL